MLIFLINFVLCVSFPPTYSFYFASTKNIISTQRLIGLSQNEQNKFDRLVKLFSDCIINHHVWIFWALLFQNESMLCIVVDLTRVTLCVFHPQLHNAANANQKEKYEADLKKEIKKLQVNTERQFRYQNWSLLRVMLSHWRADEAEILSGLLANKRSNKSRCAASCLRSRSVS